MLTFSVDTLPLPLRAREGEVGLRAGLREFVAFGYKNALSCLFPVMVFGMLALSHAVYRATGIPRYDFLLLACLVLQTLMVALKLETRDELKVICLFHLLGLAMELFKVAHGSWSYPEPALTKFGGVPLYSGFMYASVGSYVCQAWRHFRLRFRGWPPGWQAYTVGALIYINFFTNAFLTDIRLCLGAALLLVFRRTWVDFMPNRKTRRMPLVLAFVLIGFFLWLAENIATFLGAWRYASQHQGWRMVDFGKFSSWSLLVVVSIILVAGLQRRKRGDEAVLH